MSRGRILVARRPSPLRGLATWHAYEGKRRTSVIGEMMKTTSILTAATAALLIGALASRACMATATTVVTTPTYKVGVSQRRFVPPGPYNWRQARTHALLTTVWYPAAAMAHEESQWLGSSASRFARAGRAAPRAALARMPKRFPLIVISHGTGGSAPAMAWLGTRLAAHGFIAAAVNHPGNNGLEPYTSQGFSLWWLRARDLSEVIDGMLRDPRFGRRIDPHRIGAAGFSLGGYTVIEIAGGRTSPAIFGFCASHPRARRCAAPPEFPTLTSNVARLLRTSPHYRASIRRAGADYRDPRVRAIFAIAPALGAVVSADSLGRIAIPVEIVAGSADAIEPVGRNARYFAAHIPGSRLILLPGVGHYTFFATCTRRGRKAQPELCNDGPGIDRHRIHKRVAALAVAFFASHLR